MTQLTPIELNNINGRIANLTQAMLGSITPNFRSISIELTPTVVNLHFLLEHESETDREEISDIVFEYSALELGMEDSRAAAFAIVVSTNIEAFSAIPGFRIYLRRE